jgi:hypothetical protein
MKSSKEYGHLHRYNSSKYRTARQDTYRTFYKKSKISFCTYHTEYLCQLTANMMKEVPVPDLSLRLCVKYLH